MSLRSRNAENAGTKFGRANEHLLVKNQPLVPRRGLSRVESAIYVGVSPSLFDEMVKDGRMPRPRTINGRVVWDLWEVDEAFSSLPHKGGEATCNPWDDETET